MSLCKTIQPLFLFIAGIWYSVRDLNPQPAGSKPGALSIELTEYLGRKTGIEPATAGATILRSTN